MSPPRILVAGIGNIFLGDDAFGCEAARRLAARGLPPGVRVADLGIRGLDLAYALLDGYEAVILVDAAPRGGPPGTLYVLDLSAGSVPGEAEEDDGGMLEGGHGLDPARVLRLAATMGARVDRLFLVGCEPMPVEDPEEMRDGLSPPVAAAVDEAVGLVESLVARLLGGERIEGVEVVVTRDNLTIREET
jgi:hydrogenase maturation protease